MSTRCKDCNASFGFENETPQANFTFPPPMSTRCKGCNASFKRSGLYPHFQLSRNPQCELYRLELDGGELRQNIDDNTAIRAQDVAKIKHGDDEMDSAINEHGQEQLQQSPEDSEDGHGIKYFDQDEQDVPGRDLEHDQDTDMDEEGQDEQGEEKEGGDGDGDDNDDVTWLLEDECRPEPPQLPVNPEIGVDQEVDLPEKQSVFRLRGGFEEPLKNEPVVVKFPGLAGYSRMVNDDDVDMDDATVADTHNNPFAPFLSKLEWKVAKWAKLRGPGSTACSELLGIEGVSKALLIHVCFGLT